MQVASQVPTACATFQTTLVSGLLSFWLDRQQMPWMMRTSSCEKRSVCSCSQGMTWSSGSPACLDMSAVVLLTVLWSSLCPCACPTVSDRVTTETCYPNRFFPVPKPSCLSTFPSIWFAGLSIFILIFIFTLILMSDFTFVSCSRHPCSRSFFSR